MDFFYTLKGYYFESLIFGDKSQKSDFLGGGWSYWLERAWGNFPERWQHAIPWSGWWLYGCSQKDKLIGLYHQYVYTPLYVNFTSKCSLSTLSSLYLCKAPTYLSSMVFLASPLFPHGSHHFRSCSHPHALPPSWCCRYLLGATELSLSYKAL